MDVSVLPPSLSTLAARLEEMADKQHPTSIPNLSRHQMPFARKLLDERKLQSKENLQKYMNQVQLLMAAVLIGTQDEDEAILHCCLLAIALDQLPRLRRVTP